MRCCRIYPTGVLLIIKLIVIVSAVFLPFSVGVVIGHKAYPAEAYLVYIVIGGVAYLASAQKCGAGAPERTVAVFLHKRQFH